MRSFHQKLRNPSGSSADFAQDPSSDAVHRAGCVLRYVCEKRCPELGLQGAQLLQGAAPWILSERGGTCGGGWNVRQEFGWTIPVNGN